MTRISKSFGGVPALSEVDFDLLPGEVHVLAGENGAGKTTLIKVMAGVHTDHAEPLPRPARRGHDRFHPTLIGGLSPGSQSSCLPARLGRVRLGRPRRRAEGARSVSSSATPTGHRSVFIARRRRRM
jgi:energy-coupling factor transporter ATP-binding protein EcfA2